MSRGLWDYKDQALQSEIFGYGIDSVERAMKQNPLEDRELSGILYDILQLLYAYDGYACGDTGKDDYEEAKKEFKNKWLNSKPKDRIKKIIDSSILDLKDEFYSMFGITEEEDNNGKEWIY